MAAQKRSPVLGYNHNVRYRGLVFHVQTEDSGAATPHIFTHLFFGGVIINTRKHVYEADAAEDAVKQFMQAQHKATLRELKANVFDDKIDQYLAGTPGLLPRGTPDEGSAAPADSGTFGAVDAAPPATPAKAAPGATTRPPSAPLAPPGGVPHAMPRASTAPVVVARAGTGESLAAAAATAKHAATGRAPTGEPLRSVTGAFRAAAEAEAEAESVAAETGYAVHRGRTSLPPAAPEPVATAPAIAHAPAGAPSATAPRLRRNTDPRTGADIRGGGVAQKGVIVNAPSQVVVGGAARPPIPAAPGAGTAAPARAIPKMPQREQTLVDPPADARFAKDIISEKSLDEVILAYLTEEK